ncbi:dTDP-4-dehydrorhamnose reductase [Advenella sp. RU8]|uniref:dTDP-4-dehydrorhamnose reductase n=1 Tax=Advenella sp. RU8 TaxID=3399575 RepID=UPI003AACE660
MKILLLGKNGQLGWELQRALQPLGEVFALSRHNEHGLCGDLSDLQGLAKTIEYLKPEVVVNAAAYTAVDRAESDHDQAFLINAKAPAAIAQALKAHHGLLVHYSSDYVFDGSGEQTRIESALENPVNFYGHSKLEGEREIARTGCGHLIFRTSWVYGAHGGNFAKTMIKLAQEKEKLAIVEDQIGVPTGADLIADITAHAIRHYLSEVSGPARNTLDGIYHLVPDGETSWLAYANLIFGQLRARGVPLALKEVVPVTTAQYPMSARRPLNSRLNNDKIKAVFNLHMPGWESGVIRLVEELLA